jgi:hypothetical protein
MLDKNCRCSAVGIATAYGLEDLDDTGGWSSSPGKVKNIHFSISSSPALESNLLSNEYRGGGVLSLPKSKRGSLHPLHIRLHGVVFD